MARADREVGNERGVAMQRDERIQRRSRLPLMAMAFLALLGALWGGLLRLGWNWSILHPPLPMAHGPLMIGGFLGTLISLERAVALNRRWGYAAPVLCGVGALTLLAAGNTWLGALLVSFGSVLTVGIFAVVLRQHLTLYLAVMAAGAVIWLVGNVLWLLGWAIPHIVWWWLGFLVITIVGERLELSRVLRMTRWHYGTFLAALALLIGGIIVSTVTLDVGVRISGVGMAALAWWLQRYDLARRTVRKSGLTRFIAVALLMGYAWLFVGGILAIWFGGILGGPAYDAMLHSVFIGFVISMVFGHAPVIFPAVLHISLPYDRSYYYPLLLLHASLLARIVGDVVDAFALRRVGGLLNALALVLFLLNTVRLARRGIRASPPIP